MTANPPHPPPEKPPVALWPAMVWIAAGLYQFALTPASFAFWKGAVYFLAGGPVMLLVAGTAAARLRLAVQQMVTDVFPDEDWFTGLVSASLRIILGTVETLMVLFAARGLVGLLALG